MALMQLSQNQLDRLLKIFPQGVVAIDLETTGLSPLVDKIIEFSAVKVTAEGVSTLDQLINPGIPIPIESSSIHGINDQDVQEAPTLKQAFGTILSFMDELPILAHNAKFDLGFIIFSLHQEGLNYPKNNVFCTLAWARKAFPEMDGHKLGSLAKELDIPLENHHRALDDAFAALMIFVRGLEHIDPKNTKKFLSQAYQMKASDFKRNRSMELPQKLLPLVKKVATQTPVEMKYNGGSMKGQWRPIRPISLLPMPDGNILYAYCFNSSLYKSFALKKIQDLRDLSADEIQELLQKQSSAQ